MTVKDIPKFYDWLHMISNPILMKVYNGNDVHKMSELKDELVNILRLAFGMTLTYNPDNLTLS
jgi:hypothetical protein